MSWKVISERLSQPEGTVLGADDLEGCNIEALVRGGHLVPVEKKRTPSEQVPDSPRPKSTMKPVDPVTLDNSADEPEEQE